MSWLGYGFEPALSFQVSNEQVLARILQFLETFCHVERSRDISCSFPFHNFPNFDQFDKTLVRPCTSQSSKQAVFFGAVLGAVGPVLYYTWQPARDYTLGDGLFLWPTGLIIIMTHGHEHDFLATPSRR